MPPRQFCEMEDCDQEPVYCVGHFDEEMAYGLKLSHRTQEASTIIRGLLTALERAGYDNAFMAEARAWLR